MKKPNYKTVSVVPPPDGRGTPTVSYFHLYDFDFHAEKHRFTIFLAKSTKRNPSTAKVKQLDFGFLGDLTPDKMADMFRKMAKCLDKVHKTNRL